MKGVAYSRRSFPGEGGDPDGSLLVGTGPNRSVGGHYVGVVEPTVLQPCSEGQRVVGHFGEIAGTGIRRQLGVDDSQLHTGVAAGVEDTPV